MWGSILGGLAMGLGSSLPSLFGGGGDPEGGGAKKAKHHQLDYDRRRILAIVNGAKDAGIHPLAALGATSGAGGFAAPVYSGGGSHIGDAIGAGLRDALSTGMSLYESDQDRIERAQDRTDRNDQIERDRMDQIAADTIASGQRDAEQKLRDAEIRRLDSETMLNAARTRSELRAARAGALGGITQAPSMPRSVVLPYSGRWDLPPGTSPASDVADLMGEGHENLAWVENFIWNLLNDPDGAKVIFPKIGTRQPDYNVPVY